VRIEGLEVFACFRVRKGRFGNHGTSRGIVARLPQSDVSASTLRAGVLFPGTKPTGRQHPSSPQLAVEHPIARVDTTDRVQYKPHVTSDVGPEVLAETVYRGMATGQRWGRGRRQLRDP
jgi:hypothetical protein